MKRRGFFKLLGAAPAVALIPFAKATPTSTSTPAPVPIPVQECEHLWGTVPSCHYGYSNCHCMNMAVGEISSHAHSKPPYGGWMRAVCLKCGITPGAPK